MKIKEKPEDFIVMEDIWLDLGSGDYAYFLLKKKNWNTLSVIKEISKRTDIPITSISYAGSKDKNALTEQYISVRKSDREKVERIRIREVWLEFIGYSPFPIRMGDLKGNRFKIIVRDIKGIKKVGTCANYFDEQRFSMGNIDIGKMLVKREFKEICAKLELNVVKNNYINAIRDMGIRKVQFYLHSYDSYLWNNVLSRYLMNFDHFNVKYDYGYFVFLKKKINNFDIPLIKPNTRFNNKDIEKIYDSVLNKEGVSKEEMYIKEIPEINTRGTSRPAFANVSWKSLKFNKADNKAEVEFFIPKGSYATIVLKKCVRMYKL